MVEDQVLKRRYEHIEHHSTWLQLVVPRSLRDEVLRELQLGHWKDTLERRKRYIRIRSGSTGPACSEMLGTGAKSARHVNQHQRGTMHSFAARGRRVHWGSRGFTRWVAGFIGVRVDSLLRS